MRSMKRLFFSSVLLLFIGLVFFGPAMEARADELDGEPGEPAALVDEPTKSDRLVDVGGFRLHARVLGTDHRGPTLIFDAGFGQPMETWRGLPERAAETSPVIVFERAGIGDSELGPEPRTATRAVRELHRLLLEIERRDGPSGPYVLIGHSLGGLYIRIFAELYPEEVAGFVFIDPTTEGMLRSLWTEEGWARYEAQLADLTPGERAEGLQFRQHLEQLEAAGDPPDRPAIVLTARPEIAIPPEAREQMLALGLDEERLRELQELKTRLHGELAAKLPRGHQVEVDGASHFVHWQAQDRVLEAIHEVARAAATGASTD